MPENIYAAHPDVVTQAIKLLAGTVVVLGGALIATLLYIWHRLDGRIDNMEVKIDRVADSLENMDKSTTLEISKIKVRCEMNHKPHVVLETA